MESAFLKELAARGCQIEGLLNETYCGNEPLMERIVRKVPATTALTRAEQALASRDVKALFEATHELKGLYATTALTPLYGACCEIVEIARAGSLDGIDTLLPALRARHDEFCAFISRV